MLSGSVHGFLESEKIVIEAPTLREASFLFGKAMRHANERVVEKLLQGIPAEKRPAVLAMALKKYQQVVAWSESEIFTLGGENRLKNYLDTFEGYCEGSGLSLDVGAFLQIEIEAGCQTLFVQDAVTKNIRWFHSEEDIGPGFSEDFFGYRWVEMRLPHKHVSFFTYPGLCSWGHAFVVNHTHGFFQTIDDLFIGSQYSSGVIWANTLGFMAADLGTIELIEELVRRLQQSPGEKFLGGYAIHMAQVGTPPRLRSVEFAADTIQLLDPEQYGKKAIVAQANCPLDVSVQRYSDAAYPQTQKDWSLHDAELYVEMRNRRQRLFDAAIQTDWAQHNRHESIEIGLDLLANPWGDIGRYFDETKQQNVYFVSNLPSSIMMGHFVGAIDDHEATYYVGKLRPEPRPHMPYAAIETPDYPYRLANIWEEAERLHHKYTEE